MNKYLKQLVIRFPNVLCDYSTKWADPFDFLLQDESIVIDIDTELDPEKIIEKMNKANEHGYHMIRIMGVDAKFELKNANQFICANNEYDVVKNYRPKKSLPELKEIAKSRGIPKYHNMKKEELLRILKLIV